MSQYNQKNIEDMDFKELRQTVADLSADLSKYKRLLDVYMEDAESSGLRKTLKLENGRLKTEIKTVAGEIATKVSDKDMESAITQKAANIVAYVAKAAKLSEAIEVDEIPEDADINEIYVVCDYDADGNKISETYYYYNNISENWEEAVGETIYSVFEQDGHGFRLKGNVKISGDLITEGTISGITIESEDENGNIVRMEDGFLRIVRGEKLKAVLGTADDDVYSPYMVFGAGTDDINPTIVGIPYAKGTMLLLKSESGFELQFTPTLSKTPQGIWFYDDNDGKTEARIGFGNSTVDFSNATVKGFKITFG